MPFGEQKDEAPFFEKLPPQDRPLLGNRFDRFLLRRRPTIWQENEIIQEYRRALIGYLNLTPDVRSEDWQKKYYLYQLLQCPQLFHFPHGIDPAIRPVVDKMRWDVSEFLRLRESGRNPMAFVESEGRAKFPKMHGNAEGI